MSAVSMDHLSELNHLLILKADLERQREEEFEATGPNTTEISKQRVLYLSRKFKQVCQAIDNPETSHALSKHTRLFLEVMLKKNERNVGITDCQPASAPKEREVSTTQSRLSNRVSSRAVSADSSESVPCRSVDQNEKSAVPSDALDAATVKTEDSEDVFYLAGSSAVPNKILSSSLDRIGSEDSMDSDGEYTSRLGYQKKQRSKVISVEDEETAETSLTDHPTERTEPKPSLQGNGIGSGRYFPTNRDRLLEYFRSLKEQVTILRKETKTETTIELTMENRVDSSSAPTNTGDSVPESTDLSTAVLIDSQDRSISTRPPLDSEDFQDGLVQENAANSAIEASLILRDEQEDTALGEVASANNVESVDYNSGSPEIPLKYSALPKHAIKNKDRDVEKRTLESEPSQLSLALQRLLDPKNDVDTELANLEALSAKLLAGDVLPIGDYDYWSAEETIDYTDSESATEDEEEQYRRFEDMIKVVAETVGEESDTLSTEAEQSSESKKKLQNPSKLSDNKAEMEELKLLLNEISATDSEGDTDDSRSIMHRKRSSSQSSEGPSGRDSQSPIPNICGVERDMYDDSLSSDGHNESFEDFSRLVKADKDAEKQARKLSQLQGKEGRVAGERSGEESQAEYSTSSASEADDENSSDEDMSSIGVENDSTAVDQSGRVNFFEIWNADCKMTGEELEAQRRELQGLLDLEDDKKDEEKVAENITSDGENSSLRSDKEKKKRKVLKSRDENGSSTTKSSKPFFEKGELSSKKQVKPEVRTSPRKRRIIESDTDSDISDLTAHVAKKKKIEVLTVESSSESTSGLKIFEERKRRLDAKKKSVLKPMKPVKLPNRPKRKILSDHELSAESRHAKEEEEERLKRVSRLDAQLEQMRQPENVLDVSVLNLPDEDPLPVTVAVHPQLWKALRQHQKDGVRFMYRNMIQSVEHIQKAQYQGCILAHSMGLGKTLQVLAFLQAVLASLELNLKTCLVLCPAAVVLNWDSEVKEWMSRIPHDASFKPYVLKSKNLKNNSTAIAKKWKETGGVLIMSYSLYLSYCQRAEKGTGNAALLTYLREPGPDILVCDEAHTLRSERGKQLLCVRQIATTARIALTGTPLQNNLGEYYTMVNFVKPALLGSSKEFKNQFQAPIEDGTKKESSRDDVKRMKERSSILRHLLSGCLQIRGVSILTETIPPKVEYRITLRLSEMQTRLYKAFVAHCAVPGLAGSTKTFWAVMKTAQLITFHPQCLQEQEKNERHKLLEEQKKQRKNREEQSESSSTTESGDEGVDKDIAVWFEGLLPSDTNFITTLGTKAIIVREILLEAYARNDKVLIFSDRIGVLKCLEELLVSIDKENSKTPDGRPIVFKPNVNYLSFDGSTDVDKRFELINKFNRNAHAMVFLLSIKAAGMGINLVSANRVILIDPSWNPTTDKQALFRAYRYGQTKPVFVYRLVSYGTTEHLICDSQLKKDAMYGRITEEKHAKRFANSQENIFEFKESPFDPKKPFMPAKVPTDPTMLRLLEGKPELIVNVEDYDSLLEAAEPQLSVEEAVYGWLTFHWSSNDADPADKGDPFVGPAVNWAKVAERFDAGTGRCTKFKCEIGDFTSLEAFIAKYIHHVNKRLDRNQRIQDTVKKLRHDMPILRNIVDEMRQQLVAQQSERQRQQQQKQQQQYAAMHNPHNQHHRNTNLFPGQPNLQNNQANRMPQSAEELLKRHGLDTNDSLGTSPWIPDPLPVGPLNMTRHVSPQVQYRPALNPPPSRQEPRIMYARPDTLQRPAPPRGPIANPVGRLPLTNPALSMSSGQQHVLESNHNAPANMPHQ